MCVGVQLATSEGYVGGAACDHIGMGVAAWVSPVLYEILFPTRLSYLPFSFLLTAEREGSCGAKRRGACVHWWLEGGSAGFARSACRQPPPHSPAPSRPQTSTSPQPGGGGGGLLLYSIPPSLFSSNYTKVYLGRWWAVGHHHPPPSRIRRGLGRGRGLF